MKFICKIATLFCLAVLLASCNVAKEQPTQTANTPAIVPTLAEITEATVPPSPQSPENAAQSDQIQSNPVPMTPITLVLENGLTWTECALPDRHFAYVTPDMEEISNCLNMTFPSLDETDKNRFGERLADEGGADDFRLFIGSDTFETRHTNVDGFTYNYELLKNGTVIAQTDALYEVFPPNQSLANIAGKPVWEIIAPPAVIIVDGVNFNEKYQLDGSFFPYEIKGKLLYIAQTNEKYHIVYDDKTVGPEFDELSMAYCCADMSVSFGSGQYWFLGKREGMQFVVAIY
ncbi:MAG: hypothetical protein JEZ00_17735 [Anaerolineaceae bacterium]|nr:hypothetical protein [Anaerolineaceae bacterium]